MKVHELLSDASKWCQYFSFMDAAGLGTTIDKACSYCLVGALVVCYPEPYTWFSIRSKIISHLDIQYSLNIWNDDPERTYEEVISMCRELDI